MTAVRRVYRRIPSAAPNRGCRWPCRPSRVTAFRTPTQAEARCSTDKRARAALLRRRPAPSYHDAHNSEHRSANTHSATGPSAGEECTKKRTTRPTHEGRRASTANARTNQTNARAVALPRRRPGPSCDEAGNSGHRSANAHSATGPRPSPGRNAQKSGRHAQSIEKRRASRANARTNQPARFSSADAASLISAAIISGIGSSLVTMPTDCPAMTEPCSISPSITARRSAPAQ